MESEPGALALLGFMSWRRAVNFLCEKFLEILIGFGIAILQRSDPFQKINRDQLKSTALFLPFLTR